MLDEILYQKRKELEKIDFEFEIERIRKAVSKLGSIKSFSKSLTEEKNISLIAEIKRRSPSRGLLASNLDVEKTTRLYEKAGACAISVLTEKKFFGGSVEDLKAAKDCTRLPVLRKDFITEEFQVWETKLVGADAILLIAGILDAEKLCALHSLAKKIGLEVLVEVHTEDELQKALKVNPEMVGINNRNLKSFEVSLKVTERLISLVPQDVICVAESGIKKREDVLRMQELGVDAVLIGEEIVKSPDPYLKILKLSGKKK